MSGVKVEVKIKKSTITREDMNLWLEEILELPDDSDSEELEIVIDEHYTIQILFYSNYKDIKVTSVDYYDEDKTELLQIYCIGRNNLSSDTIIKAICEVVGY